MCYGSVTPRTGCDDGLWCNCGQGGVIWAIRGYRPPYDIPTPQNTAPISCRAQGSYITPLGLSLPRGKECEGVGRASSHLVRECTNAPPQPCTLAEFSKHPTPPHAQTNYTQPTIWVHIEVLRHQAVTRSDYVCLCTDFVLPACSPPEY